MLSFTDQQIHDFLAGSVTLGVVAWGLYLLLRWLKRGRRDLAIGAPVAVAVAIRVIASFGVSSASIASTLRGGDEAGFFLNYQHIAVTPFLNTQWTDVLTSKLYEFVF